MLIMVNYRRNKLLSCDAVYFLTLVTRDRALRFQRREDFLEIWNAMEFVREQFSVEFLAWVLLKDHLHWLICPHEADYSKVVMSFKRGTGLMFKNKLVLEKGQPLWQGRFWEHTIRDDRDYETHVDYIHYNPAKHELVQAPAEWPYSTFRRFVQAGQYQEDWANGGECRVPGDCFD